MQRLMIADQSDIVRKVGKRILSEMNFLVSEAGSAEEAVMRCRSEMPNVVIVDATMDNALEMIGTLRSMTGGQDCKIFYCVIEADLKKMMAGKRAGANDFLMKPFDRKILTQVFGALAMAA